MKNKICIISITVLLVIIAIFIYWLKCGDACLAQLPYFNCYTKNKFEEIDKELTNQLKQIKNLNEPSIFSISSNENIFSFKHIDGKSKSGLMKIMKNGEMENSFEIYTNNTDPMLTPLSENALVISIWQWSHDSGPYNGPFLNYYLDFKTGKTVELLTKGRLISKSQNGQKAVFLESACIKERLQEDKLTNCNNLNLSLRVVDLTGELADVVVNHYYAMNQWVDQGPPYVDFLDFGEAVFSPDNTKLAIEIKIKEVDIDRNMLDEYWTLFVADTEIGEIIEKDSKLSKNSYEYIYWLDNKKIIYW